MARKRVSGALIDYRAIFHDVPAGLAIGENRVIMDCNRAFLGIFGGTTADFVGRSFVLLYPSPELFESTGKRFAPILSDKLAFSDDRIMRRLNGELCWVNVRGFTYTAADPFVSTIWVFNELSTLAETTNANKNILTPRERDIAGLLVEGKSGKEVARALGISPRTVDIYKSRLLRKYNVTNTPSLIRILLTD